MSRLISPSAPPQPNEPPDAVDDVAQTDEDIAVRIDVLANDTDPNSDPLSVESVGAAGNGTVLIEAGGTVLYTPATNFFGEDSFTYTVSDGRGQTDTATVSVQVASVNDPPDVSDLEFTILEDSGTFALTVAADQFGSDVESDAIYFFDVTGNVGGEVTLAGEASILFYTPNENFNGTDRITVRLWDQLDAESLSTATLTINVTPVNDAPEAVADTAETQVNESVLINILTNDIDIDGDELEIANAGPAGFRRSGRHTERNRIHSSHRLCWHRQLLLHHHRSRRRNVFGIGSGNGQRSDFAWRRQWVN